MNTNEPVYDIPIDKIKIDPKQPRKFFAEAAIAELTASVKVHGVIEPILVRPFEDHYLLVYGERRLRASIGAGKIEIPGRIKELTDEQARQYQLIENIQREDLHFMEEAEAFLVMLGDASLSEVAAKASKPEDYVKQRVVLNDLTEGWKKGCLMNLVSLRNALHIAVMTAEQQQELYKALRAETSIQDKTRIQIPATVLQKFQGDLTTATFALEDADLDASVGACSSCSRNSATLSLFPDEVKRPICSNVPCFVNKCNLAFARDLIIAQEDPAIALISTVYYTSNIDFSQFEKNGKRVYKASQYELADKHIPAKPVWENFIFGRVGSSEEQLRETFNRYVKEYDGEVSRFQAGVTGGLYTKAFIVAGSNKGQFTYITINEKTKTTAKETAEKMKAGTVTVEDIDNEMLRLDHQEERAQELDQQAIHREIVDQLKELPALKEKSVALVPKMKPLIAFLLLEHIHEFSRGEMMTTIGVSDPKGNQGLQRKFFADLEAMPDENFCLLVQDILVDRYDVQLPHQKGGTALRLLAEMLGGIDIAAIERKRTIEVTAPRQDRLAEKMENLRDKREDLINGVDGSAGSAGDDVPAGDDSNQSPPSQPPKTRKKPPAATSPTKPDSKKTGATAAAQKKDPKKKEAKRESTKKGNKKAKN